jgi:hypothetical protein
MRFIYIFSTLTVLISTNTFAENKEGFCFNTAYKVSFSANSYIYDNRVKAHTIHGRNQIIEKERRACEFESGRLSVIKRYTVLNKISRNFNLVISSAIVSCNLRKRR